MGYGVTRYGATLTGVSTLSGSHYTSATVARTAGKPIKRRGLASRCKTIYGTVSHLGFPNSISILSDFLVIMETNLILTTSTQSRARF